MVYRVLRYRTSALSNSSDFYDKELAHPSDETPSVYVISQAERVRIHAEHMAGANLRPPTSTVVGIDLTNIVDSKNVVYQDPGGVFAYRKQTHHVVPLKDKTLWASQVFNMVQNKETLEISKSELRTYVNEEIASGNEEWLGFIKTDSGTPWARWAKV